ncbi:Pimeloyl-ACP methyl ester carboxylesterase [Sphingomonas sp. NFR04]|uniref:alpha/beta fold hydrolase n=1 Tax=Sphingomonas sp. NFR04 TaxID=1566283 RepID=UPI0008F2F367|nr:alpha/beta hydrolase [Sphingomonas sp. NFR04]SFK05266.1 Pimeloyl-ACP methyl ester carboxylesterase [Sphingomonas sp. NFR04]
MNRFVRCLCRRDKRLPWFAILIALLAANGFAKQANAAPAPTSVATAADMLVQMDHISVQVLGRGSPVVLIPGLSSPRATWDGVVPELIKNHRVYLVQVNGFGGDDPRGNLQPGILDGVVADLHTLIESRKLGAVPVVGHSMGGLVTLMLARAHPEDVKKALIVDALPFIGTLFAPAATAESLKPQAEMMRAQMASLYGKPVPEQVGQMIARQNALKPASQEKVAGWSAKADMRVSGQAIYEDMTTDLRPELPKIAAPITVLVPWTEARGGEEKILGLYRAQYAGAPHATIRGVGDSGHFLMLDQPAAFERALMTFLN